MYSTYIASIGACCSWPVDVSATVAYLAHEVAQTQDHGENLKVLCSY